jgi:hypothetical protein
MGVPRVLEAEWPKRGSLLPLQGVLQIFLARSVSRHARWAYVIALLFGLGGALPRLLNLVTPHR